MEYLLQLETKECSNVSREDAKARSFFGSRETEIPFSFAPSRLRVRTFRTQLADTGRGSTPVTSKIPEVFKARKESRLACHVKK
jgi:hypothetical protein